MVELISSEGDYTTGYRAGKSEQLRNDISLIRDVAFRSNNFEDFKIKLRDELKKIDRQTWF